MHSASVLKNNKSTLASNKEEEEIIAERNTYGDKITRAFKQNKGQPKGRIPAICLKNLKKEEKYAHLSS